MEGIIIRWCVKCDRYTYHRKNKENPADLNPKCVEHNPFQ